MENKNIITLQELYRERKSLENSAKDFSEMLEDAIVEDAWGVVEKYRAVLYKCLERLSDLNWTIGYLESY